MKADPVVWNKVEAENQQQNWVASVVEYEADAAMASMEADAATSPTSNTKPKYSVGEVASASKACWQQQNYHVERNQCAAGQRPTLWRRLAWRLTWEVVWRTCSFCCTEGTPHQWHRSKRQGIGWCKWAAKAAAVVEAEAARLRGHRINVHIH